MTDNSRHPDLGPELLPILPRELPGAPNVMTLAPDDEAHLLVADATAAIANAGRAVEAAVGQLRNRIAADAQTIVRLTALIVEQEQGAGWRARANADIAAAQEQARELVEKHKLTLLDLRAGLEVAAKALIEGCADAANADANEVNADANEVDGDAAQHLKALITAALNPLASACDDALTALNHRPAR